MIWLTLYAAWCRSSVTASANSFCPYLTGGRLCFSGRWFWTYGLSGFFWIHLYLNSVSCLIVFYFNTVVNDCFIKHNISSYDSFHSFVIDQSVTFGFLVVPKQSQLFSFYSVLIWYMCICYASKHFQILVFYHSIAHMGSNLLLLLLTAFDSSHMLLWLLPLSSNNQINLHE